MKTGWQSFQNSRVNLGRVAVIRPVDTQVDLILIAHRSQTYEPDIFLNLGIDFKQKDFLLVKSTNHFQAGFEPIASEIIYLSAPTSYPTNPATAAYRKASLDLWPRVADPLGLD